MLDKTEAFNFYFKPVHSQPNSQFDCATGNPDGTPTLNNLANSMKFIISILKETDTTKSRGPDANPPTFFQKLS